jgi:hypothetical protein
MEPFEFQYKSGAHYLGSFLGDEAEQEEWVDKKVKDWIQFNKTLARMAKLYLQMAYDGMTAWSF